MFWLLIAVLLMGFGVLFYGDAKGRYRIALLGAGIILVAWFPLLFHVY